VRILAATARNLDEAVRQGTFREDLFYRLNVLPITIPPLRERTEDIPLLARHFMHTFNLAMERNVRSITPEAMEKLLAYGWPGNVRELENTIQRGVVLAEAESIGLEHLPPHLVAVSTVASPDHQCFPGFSIKEAQKTMEETIIRKALRETGGNRLQASKLLEISYPSLLSKIRDYQIIVEVAAK
jgi:two-component system response regulator AtoC